MIAPVRGGTATQCEAVAVSTRLRCRNPATLEGTERAGSPCCDYGSHIRQLRERNGLGHEPAPGAELPEPAAQATPELPPAPAIDAEIAALLEGLPDEPADLGTSGRVSGAPRFTDELEDRAARVLGGEIPEDPAEADELAEDEAAAPRARAAVLEAARAGSNFTAERVRFYLEVIINPQLRKAKKEELTNDELEEGGELGAIVLQDLFGPRAIENPYLALAAWFALVLGSRYFDELMRWVADAARWMRGSSLAPVLNPLPPPQENGAGPPGESFGYPW